MSKRAVAFKFKPFSRKQRKVLSWWRPGSPYADYDGIIADGSIRSGKTIAFILGFVLWSTRSFKGCNFILSGRTIGTLKRNVIAPMLMILRTLRISFTYNRGENGLEFGENTYYLFGADNEASQDKIQGLTCAGWLADEVALHHPDFIQQAIGRCSVDGSRYWLNCNPENPHHYVKVDLIDQAASKRLLHLHFDLDDNLTLTAKVKERYARMFVGMWYQRMILGLWVAAEGAIYGMIDRERHVADTLPAMSAYHVGVDYGTSGVTTFWLLGIGEDHKLYFVDFFRWDAKKKFRQLSDAEAAEELDKWLGGLQLKPKSIVIPHDAASLLNEIKRSQRAGRLPNIGRLAWADQSPGSVVIGLRDLGSLFTRGTLLFSREVERKGGMVEWTGYTWDPNAAEAGDDAPLKEHDHDPDAGRYVVEHVKSTWSRWQYGASEQSRLAA